LRAAVTRAAGNEARSPLVFEAKENSMRLILFLAVIALGADALLNNGSYTQAAWNEASVQFHRLTGEAHHAVGAIANRT
jgi:hypothetical protein